MRDIRVLIVEDEPLIAEDLAAILEREGFSISAVVYTPEDAMEELQTHLPDIALLDINLSGAQEGITLAEHIHAHLHIPHVFITSYSDKHTLDKAKHTEPAGYIVKPFNEAGLYSTLEIALYNHAQKTARMFPPLELEVINRRLKEKLSEREFELLQAIYDGKSNKQIAEAMFISENTVKKHIAHSYEKLEAHSRATVIAALRRLMRP